MMRNHATEYFTECRFVDLFLSIIFMLAIVSIVGCQSTARGPTDIELLRWAIGWEESLAVPDCVENSQGIGTRIWKEQISIIEDMLDGSDADPPFAFGIAVAYLDRVTGTTAEMDTAIGYIRTSTDALHQSVSRWNKWYIRNEKKNNFDRYLCEIYKHFLQSRSDDRMRSGITLDKLLRN